jgi:hypothetical protein
MRIRIGGRQSLIRHILSHHFIAHNRNKSVRRTVAPINRLSVKLYLCPTRLSGSGYAKCTEVTIRVRDIDLDTRIAVSEKKARPRTALLDRLVPTRHHLPKDEFFSNAETQREYLSRASSGHAFSWC